MKINDNSFSSMFCQLFSFFLSLIFFVNIRSFAEKKPRLHVDIAGIVWVYSPDYAYQDKYATGVCVDTVAEWLGKCKLTE